mmetsp:Transcript_90572/g.270232  ORF Transcript_90572/g.270232 Transcript_90572/m.270232 type:complete len:335 (+) Transcript_90572:39-1043(+)
MLAARPAALWPQPPKLARAQQAALQRKGPAASAAGSRGGVDFRLLCCLAGARLPLQRRRLRRRRGAVGVMEPCARALHAGRAALPWQSLRHVYCINLDRRPERWSFMQQQFAHLRLPAQRWSAVDGRTINVPELAEMGLIAKEALPRYYLPDEQKLFGTDLTDGGIGCALSHMMIWRDILSRRDEASVGPSGAFLVVEDDCQFLPGFSEGLLNSRLSHVPEDWELIYLGGQDLMHRQHEYQVAEGVRRLYKGFRETTAYLINEAGAKAALEVCVPMYWQIDTHLNDESLREGLRPPRPGETDYTMRPRGYCLWPPLVAQERKAFKTDVQKVEHD